MDAVTDAWDGRPLQAEARPWADASTEPLQVIESNECNAGYGSLATKRFRRLVNEIAALRADLAARDAATREKALREAAEVADCGCAARQDVLARLAEAGERKARNLCLHGDVCCALQAAAILALIPQQQEDRTDG